MQSRNTVWMFALGAMIGVLAGCDDDEDVRPDAGLRDAAVVDATVREDAAVPDARVPDAFVPDAGPRSIAQIAQASPELSVLVTAVTRADLGDALAGEGPLTVFAPTNAAFAAAGITEAMIETMPMADLQRLLSYHVIAGRELTADELRALDDPFVETLAENQWDLPMSVVVVTDATTVRVNDATVLAADVRATNGVVHQIDRVLVPPTIVQMATYAGLEELLAAVSRAAPLADGRTLVQVLQSPGPITVFAPTNEAFEAQRELIDGLDADEIRSVIAFHVLSPDSYDEPVEIQDMPTHEDARVQTVLGPPVHIDVTVTPPTVRDGTMVATDIHVANGTIHVIDIVLLPPGIDPATL